MSRYAIFFVVAVLVISQAFPEFIHALSNVVRLVGDWVPIISFAGFVNCLMWMFFMREYGVNARVVARRPRNVFPEQHVDRHSDSDVNEEDEEDNDTN